MVSFNKQNILYMKELINVVKEQMRVIIELESSIYNVRKLVKEKIKTRV